MNRLLDFVKVVPSLGVISAIAPFPLAILLMVIGVGFVEVVAFYVFAFYATFIPLAMLTWRGVSIRFNRR